MQMYQNIHLLLNAEEEKSNNMKDLFNDVLLLSLMASTIGNFWTLCLGKNMIFGGFGYKIRSRIKRSTDRDKVVHGTWAKFLKGLQCPYCVSVWIIIVIHMFYYHVFQPTIFTVGYLIISVFLLLFEIGLTTLINKITSVFINQNLRL